MSILSVMKQLAIILVVGLFFISKSQAQYLGSELGIEQVQSNQPDYIITLGVYQDTSSIFIKDSIKIYFVDDNSTSFFIYVIKINEISLYENVKKVVYQYQGLVPFFSLSNRVYFRTQDSLQSNEIINLSNNGMVAVNSYAWQLNAGGWWGDFNTPIFQYGQHDFYKNNGYLKHDASCSLPSFVDSIHYDLVSIDSSHFYPNGITINNQTGVLSIDSTLSGKYLVNIRVSSWMISAERTIHNRVMVVDVDKAKNELSTSTLSLEKGVNMSVFPNPTSDLLQITTQKPLNEVQLYNTLGQQIYQQQGLQQEQVQVDVSHLPKGMYIVRVRQGEVWGSEQVVIQ